MKRTCVNCCQDAQHHSSCSRHGTAYVWSLLSDSHRALHYEGVPAEMAHDQCRTESVCRTRLRSELTGPKQAFMVLPLLVSRGSDFTFR